MYSNWILNELQGYELMYKYTIRSLILAVCMLCGQIIINYHTLNNKIEELTLQYEQAKNAHLEASRIWNTERYQKHLENATYVRRAE